MKAAISQMVQVLEDPQELHGHGEAKKAVALIKQVMSMKCSKNILGLERVGIFVPEYSSTINLF